MLNSIDLETQSIVEKTDDDQEENDKIVKSMNLQVKFIQREIELDEKILKIQNQFQLKSNKTEAAVHNVEELLLKVNQDSKASSLIQLIMKAVLGAIPSEFCWKKRGGSIPADCPSGFVKILGSCYQKCPENFSNSFGICSSNCQQGFDEIGNYCHRWKFLHTIRRQTFIPQMIPNFQSKVPCQKGKYKEAGFCYDDCQKFGMFNCNIGTCSRDKSSCDQGFNKLDDQDLEKIIYGVGDLMQLKQLSEQNLSMMKKIPQIIGSKTLNNMTKRIRKWLNKISQKVLIDIIMNTVQNKIDKAGDMVQKIAKALKSFDAQESLEINLQEKNMKEVLSKLDQKQIVQSIIKRLLLMNRTGVFIIAAIFMNLNCG